MDWSCRQQVHIEAPPEVVWELVGDPNRHPEWWPDMVEMECAAIEEGCRYRGVVKGFLGKEEEHELMLDRLEECREVVISCDGTGVSTGFTLADAQGGTFVEGRFSVEPQSLGSKVFGAIAGKRLLRSWLDKSLESLKRSAEQLPAR